MRSDIAFDADGTRLRGWLYLPAGAGPHPAVVMAHGFSALKEMGLDRYAEVFCAAGLACLVYDHRNFGASDGAPRFEIDPVAQMRDYRHAVTHLTLRSEIDAQRIGVWGTSYSGGLVLMAAALDRRIACVVSQVPYISGHETLRYLTGPEERRALHALLERERRSIAAGSEPATVPVCKEPPSEAGRSTYNYFFGFKRQGVPWENRITLRSLDYRLEYEAMPYMERISPTPLLMIIAARDAITPTELAQRAFERAAAPKKVLIIGEDHYDPYLGQFDPSSVAARDWFCEHLCS